MNAVLGFVNAADQQQRYETVRRRNAENAYERQTQFREQAAKSKAELKNDLDALLRGDMEPEELKESEQFQKLGAGQVKNIAIPVGNTLEETIDLWRDVRREAYSEPEPTTADYQLASKASAKIAEAELQLALHNRAKTIREQMKLAGAGNLAAVPVDGTTSTAMDRMQKWFDQAVSVYSVQSQARVNQYQVDSPVLSAIV